MNLTVGLDTALERLLVSGYAVGEVLFGDKQALLFVIDKLGTLVVAVRG